ncbi:YcnI family protein [Planotetraspora sp. A-T 1434]|uniref:YcnI family copper-binding membrane protein n=1 Tax=Planotetraspora sp. A-T 1434 TaxID=2979219 RepID=UPI0021C0707C|nr:YcnI family protein [Planotetraspora sp. A-T 1434]MCT9935220.1 YcnI family protein [Planotetraspora sp. A-T 1434]
MAFNAALRRAGAVTAGALAITLGLALPALAHVTINPGTAEQGGWTKVAFRVPNERDTESTTQVEVDFPTDHPLPFVSVRPVPGWDVKLTQGKLPKPIVSDDGDKVTESVLKITWSGGKIEPGQFQEFEVSVGPLPKNVDQLAFPTTQKYSNGEVVKWADAPKADGSEGEHPVPVLKLVAASGDAGDHHSTGALTPAPSVAAAKDDDHASAASESGADSTARVIGGAGIAVGLIGTAVGVMGLRRSRR